MKKWMRRLRIPLLLGVMLLAVFSYYVLIPVEINGSSMAPSLEPDDRVIAKTFYELDRFDVIVFRDENNQPVVKRVIGLPGEDIRYEDDQLYVNQEPVEEPFLSQASLEPSRGTWTSDFQLSEVMDDSVIPPGSYFVLGDNRRLSYDSRVYGPVPEEAIIGEVVMIMYPFDRITFSYE